MAFYDPHKDDPQYQKAFGMLQNMPRRKSHTPEADLQAACFKYFHLQYSKFYTLFFCIKNDGQKKIINAKNGRPVNIGGVRDKLLGIKRGVADTFLSIPRGPYAGLYIEFKIKPNKQSPDQIEFMKEVRGQGYGYLLAYSKEEFISAINNYMNLPYEATTIPTG